MCLSKKPKKERSEYGPVPELSPNPPRFLVGSIIVNQGRSLACKEEETTGQFILYLLIQTGWSYIYRERGKILSAKAVAGPAGVQSLRFKVQSRRRGSGDYQRFWRRYMPLQGVTAVTAVTKSGAGCLMLDV